mgnify:CR=1 FL=1
MTALMNYECSLGSIGLFMLCIEDDSIVYNVPYNRKDVHQTSKLYNWPRKCPRKTDCPDWSYNKDDTFHSQIQVLTDIAKIQNIDLIRMDWLLDQEMWIN